MNLFETMGMRRRILISGLIGILAGWYCFFLAKTLHQGAGDFHWAIYLANRFLAHQPLYEDTPLYPFTAAFFGLPLVRLPLEVAAGIFYGISSALLAFALTREGYHRLLIFLAYPYWIGMVTVQWSPLIAASAFFPWLLPATMAKPQIGIPVFLSRFSRRGLLACVIFGVITLIAAPRWPLEWVGQFGHYNHFFAITLLPGPLVLLALWRYRDRDAWLLVLSSIMPMRWFYDVFVLWLIPKSSREIMATVFFSWCAGIWRWYHPPTSFDQVGRWIVLSTYLPMLVIVLLRSASPALSPEANDSSLATPYSNAPDRSYRTRT